MKTVQSNPSFIGSLTNLFSSSAIAGIGEEPLTNAKVTIKSYSTGKNFGTATTDSQGRYSISGIPKGADVVVIAVKDLNTGETVRISGVVPDVGRQSRINGDIDADTSVAAESIGDNMGQSKNIDTVQVENAHERAHQALEERRTSGQEIDLTTDGNILSNEFGNLNDYTLESKIEVTIEEISGGNTYSDDYFEIKFPENWSGNDSLLNSFSDPKVEEINMVWMNDDSYLLNFQVIRIKYNQSVSQLGGSIKEIGDKFKEAFTSFDSESDKNITIKDENYTTFGSQKAYKIELKATDNITDTTSYSTIIFTYKGSNFYMLMYNAEGAAYENNLSTFMQISNSFKMY